MRGPLYGSLAVLTAVVVFAVVLGEASDGALTGWDVALVVLGLAALGGAFIVAMVALAYEVRELWRRKARV